MIIVIIITFIINIIIITHNVDILIITSIAIIIVVTIIFTVIVLMYYYYLCYFLWGDKYFISWFTDPPHFFQVLENENNWKINFIFPRRS